MTVTVTRAVRGVHTPGRRGCTTAARQTRAVSEKQGSDPQPCPRETRPFIVSRRGAQRVGPTRHEQTRPPKTPPGVRPQDTPRTDTTTTNTARGQTPGHAPNRHDHHEHRPGSDPGACLARTCDRQVGGDRSGVRPRGMSESRGHTPSSHNGEVFLTVTVTVTRAVRGVHSARRSGCTGGCEADPGRVRKAGVRPRGSRVLARHSPVSH